MSDVIRRAGDEYNAGPGAREFSRAIMCERCKLRRATHRVMTAANWSDLVVKPTRLRECAACTIESAQLLAASRQVFSCSPIEAT